MSGLSKEDEARLSRFILGEDEEVFREFFVVLHRNRPGVIVPLEANPLQSQLAKAMRRALQCNLRIQKKVVSEGGRSYIHKLKDRLEAGAAIPPHEIGLRMLIGKSRRGGCSTWLGHVGLRRTAAVPNTRALIMAHTDGTAVELAQYPKTTLSHWPVSDDIRPMATRDTDNNLAFTNGSRYTIRTAGTTRNSGSGKRGAATRGFQFDFYHLSEYAHFATYVDSIQMNAVAQPHCWMFKESTANGASGPFYDEWQKALSVEQVEAALDEDDAATLSGWDGTFKFFFSWLDDPGLVEHVFDRDRDVIMSSLDDYERALMEVDSRFTLERVAFRRKTIQGLREQDGMSPEQFFAQEYPATPEEMFQATGSTAFDQKALAAMSAAVRGMRPRKFRVSRDALPVPEFRGGHNLVVYERPRPGRYYVMGSDLGKGIRKDFSWSSVFDRTDGTRLIHVADLVSNVIEPYDFAHASAMLGEWYNEAFITPEGGPSDAGVSFCNALFNVIGYPNIYARDDPSTALSFYNGGSYKLGFHTTNTNKSYLVNHARPAIRDGSLVIKNPEMIRQFRAFKVKDDNRYSAPEGDYDDAVIAGCLALWGNRAPSAPTIVRRVLEVAKARAQAEAQASNPRFWEEVNAMISRQVRKNLKGKRRGGVLLPVDPSNRGR